MPPGQLRRVEREQVGEVTLPRGGRVLGQAGRQAAREPDPRGRLELRLARREL